MVNPDGVKIRIVAGFNRSGDAREEVTRFTGVPVGDSPSPGIFRLRRKSSDRWVLETAFEPYYAARVHAINILKYIDELCSTDAQSVFHVDVRVTDGTRVLTSILDPMKVVLGFDESMVVRDFPLGPMVSVKSLVSSSSSQVVKAKADIASYQVTVSDQAGLDFTRTASDGCVRIKYFRGAGYERKTSTIMQAIDRISELSVEAAANPRRYTDSEKVEFARLVDRSFEARRKCVDYPTFASAFPMVTLTVDMHERSVVGVYPRFRDDLASLMELCDFAPVEDGDSVDINYDTERGMLQVRFSTVSSRGVSRVDFVGCELTGGYYRCQAFDCKVTNSTMDCCYLKDCPVQASSLINCYLDEGTLVQESAVIGAVSVVACEVSNSRIDAGVIKKGSEIKDCDVSKKVRREE